MCLNMAVAIASDSFFRSAFPKEPAAALITELKEINRDLINIHRSAAAVSLRKVQLESGSSNEEILQLEQLQSLDLSDTCIIEWSSLSSLKELTVLYLRKNNISDGYFLRSLEKLDSIVVSSMKTYSITVNGSTNHSGGYYIYNTTSCKISDLESKMKEMLPKYDAPNVPILMSEGTAGKNFSHRANSFSCSTLHTQDIHWLPSPSNFVKALPHQIWSQMLQARSQRRVPP